MDKDFKKHYFKLITPTILLFLIFGVSETFHLSLLKKFTAPSFFPTLFFILSAITAIAGPLFIRTYFAHSKRNEKQVSKESFKKFQKGLMNLSMLTPFFAFIAIVSEFEKFYCASIIMFALYSIYYYFPTKKRVDFDKKIFRVNE